MRILIFAFILLVSPQVLAEKLFVSVCDRHPKVQEGIRVALNERPCQEVSSQDLWTIEVLEIKNVRTSELSEIDFSALRGLKILKITGHQNFKEPIDLKIINRFKKLNALILTNIDLSHAPNDFLIRHRSLTHVTLMNCNLKEFPHLFKPVPFLDLSQNQIKKLPETLSQVEANSVLVLEGNQITDISNHLESLSEIIALHLAGNPIHPLTCEQQFSLLFAIESGELNIDTKSVNMDPLCNFPDRLPHLTLNGGSTRDFSIKFKKALVQQFFISFSKFEVADSLSELIASKSKSIGRVLQLIDSDLSSLDLSDPNWQDKKFDIRIKDGSRSHLPNIFNGTDSIRSVAIEMPNLNYLPQNTFEDMESLEALSFKDTPLNQTSKATIQGIPQVFGLPTNFGVTETGGTSEEWAP